MGDRYVALVRGINVGKAKRVPMADLRAAIVELGYSEVRTLLNSGNVVFTAPRAAPSVAARRIEEALASRCGVAARVTVLTAEELARVAAENPLLRVADNTSRLLVAVLADPADRELLEPLARERWAPEALGLGARVAYLWCPNGVLASSVAKAVDRLLGDSVTTRNWATVRKLDELARERRP